MNKKTGKAIKDGIITGAAGATLAGTATGTATTTAAAAGYGFSTIVLAGGTAVMETSTPLIIGALASNPFGWVIGLGLVGAAIGFGLTALNSDENG